MLADSRAMHMLILIPVFAVLLALVFSITGVVPGSTVAEKPAGSSAFIHAMLAFSDALYVTASGGNTSPGKRPWVASSHGVLTHVGVDRRSEMP